MLNLDKLTLYFDISRLKHPFYALVYAAKGPFVLYKIHNIIFEHGNAKSALFLDGGFPNSLMFAIRIKIVLRFSIQYLEGF